MMSVFCPFRFFLYIHPVFSFFLVSPFIVFSCVLHFPLFSFPSFSHPVLSILHYFLLVQLFLSSPISQVFILVLYTFSLANFCLQFSFSLVSLLLSFLGHRTPDFRLDCQPPLPLPSPYLPCSFLGPFLSPSTSPSLPCPLLPLDFALPLTVFAARS